MRSHRLICLFACIYLSILASGQKKTVLRIEVPVFCATEEFLKHGPYHGLLPTVYVPIGLHFEFGASYNSIKPFDREDVNPTELEYGYEVKHNIVSFYANVNFSRPNKKFIPSLGYIFSTTKGKFTDISLSGNSNLTQNDREILKTAVESSVIAHGLQLGLEFNLSSLVSIFYKFRYYNSSNQNPPVGEKGPFVFKFQDLNKNQFESENYEHHILGVFLKIYRGKKALIK